MSEKIISDAAKRAIAEADERRTQIALDEAKQMEIGGPKGQEPTRYGDWERKGIAYDF